MVKELVATFDHDDTSVLHSQNIHARTVGDPELLVEAAQATYVQFVMPVRDVFAGGEVQPAGVEQFLHELAGAGVKDAVQVNVPSGFKSLRESLVDPKDNDALKRWNTYVDRGNLIDLAPHALAPWEPGGSGPRWPRPLGRAARIGLIGEFLQHIEPITEADPAALAATLLAYFGVRVGRSPYLVVDGARHRANLFVLVVGKTSAARKGTSLAHVQKLFDAVDSTWVKERVLSGATSGEGIIFHVRDAKYGVNNKGEDVLQDHGVEDNRLLLRESEFARTLVCMGRDHSTLGTVLRCSWDGDEVLTTLTKNMPDKATGAHIGMLAHITEYELACRLRETDTMGGTINRFLLVAAKRARVLAFGGAVIPDVMSRLASKLRAALDRASKIDEMTFSQDARAIFEHHYDRLSSARPGILDAVTARSAPMAHRVAMNHALLDGSSVIEGRHMLAGIEWVRYSMETAHHLFGGGGTGNRDADKIMAFVVTRPVGAARSVLVSQVFSGHISSTRMDAARDLLRDLDLVTCQTKDTDGRPCEIWVARREKSERSGVA